MVTGLSKPLRNEKPVLHAAFRAIYYVSFTGGNGIGWRSSWLYPGSLAESMREYSSPVSG